MLCKVIVLFATDLYRMNDLTTICKTTGETITIEEMNYRDGRRDEILAKFQFQFGKTRHQVLELFRYYSKKDK